MKKIFNTRIPTILGIIVVLLGIPLTTILVRNQTVLKSTASNSQDPQNVQITNISDKSFTITYQTDAPATGSISYGRDKKLGESELEDLDKEKGSFSPKTIHSISIEKLIPSTKYYFAIISEASTFLNNGVVFETITGPGISPSSEKQNVIKGRIILPDGNAPTEALVYLNAENSQLLSSTIAKDGKFSFLLKDLRTEDFSSYFDVNDNTIFKIFATDGSLESTALVSLNETTIPTITLSNDYDFTQNSSPIASSSGELLGFPSISSTSSKSKPQILSPKEDQTFNSQKPRFAGTSLPNEKVEIIIHSDEALTTEITADNNGNWTYLPPTDLSPGVHTITIKTRDSSGILTTIMRSFTIFAAEAVLTPTTSPAIPTQAVTSTPTLFPTPTIAILIPTLTPTPTPTIFPSPTFAAIESKGGIPPTGNSPIFLIIGGIVTAISGLMLFLLTRTIL